MAIVTIIGGVSSFGVEWFAENILPILPEGSKVITVTKGLLDMNIDEAKEELNDTTLESLVVAEHVARAVKISADNGVLDRKNYPQLMHIDEILTEKKEVNIPWEDFTFRFEE